MESSEQPTTDFGHYLRAQRRSRKMDMETVAQRTKIRVALLQQIENEDFSALPEPVFTKGFIRSYAEAVGADGQEAVRRYEAGYAAFHTPDQDESVDGQSKAQPVPRWVPIIVVLILLAAAAIIYFIKYYGEPPKTGDASESSMTTNDRASQTGEEPQVEMGQAPATEAKAPAAVEAIGPEPTATVEPTTKEPELATPADGDEEGRESPAAQESAAPSSEGTVAPSATAEPITGSDNPPSSADAEVGQPMEPASPSAARVLRIEAVETCWMKIAIDGNDPKEVTLQRGEEAVFKAKGSFKLLIGNAGGVRLTLDDQPVEVPGRSGQVARLTLP